MSGNKAYYHDLPIFVSTFAVLVRIKALRFLGQTLLKNMASKKVALIQPIVELGKSLRIQKSPTSIQVLSARLKQEGYNVEMFHRPVESALYEEIFAFDPDYIGISTMTVNFPAGQRIAREIRKRKPDIPIILGGWHASGCANSYINGYENWSLKEILNIESPFDFIIVGEGEDSLPSLLNELRHAPRNVWWKVLESKKGKGIGCLVPDGTIRITQAERITCLDSLPDPDWEGLDVDLYRDGRTGKLDISIHAQRGCRFKCAFCQTPDAYPGKQTHFSTQRTADYISFLVRELKADVITFTDEDFMANTRWIESLSKEVIKERLHRIRFDTFATVEDIIRLGKRGTLHLLKTAGLSSYFVGIESLIEPTLKLYERPHLRKGKIEIDTYLTHIQNAIDISIQNGIGFMGDYMLGFFMETEEDVRKGFNRLKELIGLTYIYLPLFTPLPGTKFWKLAVDHNMLKKDTYGRIPWELFDCSHQVTNVDYDLEGLREELEQDYFTSPNFLKGMKNAIERNPFSLEDWYLPVFKRLLVDYPANRKIKDIVSTLNNTKASKTVVYPPR